MGQYLTIPGAVEAEELLSFTRGPDEKSVVVVIRMGDTSNFLFRASADGRNLELVVIMTDALTLALDDVVVTSVSFGSGDPEPDVTIGLDARGIRYT